MLLYETHDDVELICNAGLLSNPGKTMPLYDESNYSSKYHLWLQGNWNLPNRSTQAQTSTPSSSSSIFPQPSTSGAVLSAVTFAEVRPCATAPPQKANTTLNDTPVKEAIELAAEAKNSLRKLDRRKKKKSDSESSEANADPVPQDSDSEEREPQEEPLLMKGGAYVVVK